MTDSNVLYKLKFDENEKLLDEDEFHKISKQPISSFTAK
jgi:hypothetical protein